MRAFLSLFLLCLVSTAAVAQRPGSPGNAAQRNEDWGVGLRLGDPLGVSVKRYLPHRKAVELNVGRTWNYNYSRIFYRHYPSERYYYEGHRNRSSVSVQARYLLHRRLRHPQLRGVEWYYGGGAQLRLFRVDYHYRRYEEAPEAAYLRTDRIAQTDLGLDGTIGLEYLHPRTPLSVFVDLNLFLELTDNLLTPHGQGGIGGRYYF